MIIKYHGVIIISQLNPNDKLQKNPNAKAQSSNEIQSSNDKIYK
jgi:hypothetical protein